jgi:hypothetical protein
VPQNAFPWTGNEAPTFDEIRDKPSTYPPQAATTTVVGGVLKTPAQTANAANIPSNAPDGGTGTAAGGWDTAQNRDAAITTINTLVASFASLQTDFNALLAKLRDAGIVTSA